MECSNFVVLETKTQCVRDKNKSKRKKNIFSLPLPFFKAIFVVMLHKKFFEQLWRRKEKESFGVTVSTKPERLENDAR